MDTMKEQARNTDSATEATGQMSTETDRGKPKKAHFPNNRTVIGIICMVLAVFMIFVLTPLINKASDDTVQVIRVAATVEQGMQIQKSNLEVVEVKKNTVPPEIVNNSKEIVGKYALTRLHAGDYIYKDTITSTYGGADAAFSGLDGSGKVAISVTCRGFAQGLSNKLENGDIISLIVTDESGSYIPGALKYLSIVTTTTSGGLDRDEVSPDESGQLPQYVTFTFLVTEAQAKLLATYEQTGKPMYAVLVYRTSSGSQDKAKEFVAKQDAWLESCEHLTDVYTDPPQTSESANNTDTE